MSKVIFYHIYMYGNYQAMVTEQLNKLISTGLFDACDKLHIGIASPSSPVVPSRRPKKMVPSPHRAVTTTNPKIVFPQEITCNKKVEIKHYPQNMEETSTMKWIKDYAILNPDAYVLYFHTKGVSKQSPATEDWRRYMEYFSIERWRDCVIKLDEGYDCCGVMWITNTTWGKLPHFSGTMWWATAKYINTLDPAYLDNPNRYYREFWIGSAKKVKQYEFHNSGLNEMGRQFNHYHARYPRINYVPKEENGRRITLHVFIASYQLIPELEMLINSFLVQTYPEWKLHIWHDGEAPRQLKRMTDEYAGEQRISFIETKERTATFGHINRRRFLETIDANKDDYILMTNHDNYYTPVFVERMLNECNGTVGMVYCNTLHSYFDYQVLNTEVRMDHIDMGSFIVKASVAKAVGFTGTHYAADGTYAVACAAYCKRLGLSVVYVPRVYYVHN